MRVGMWMTPEVVTIPPDASVAAAAGLAARRRIRRLLVTHDGTREGRLIGLVTLGDLMHAFPRDLNPLSPLAEDQGPRTPVATIMARALTVADPDLPIEEAAGLLCTHKIGSLPVVRDGTLVGIITESDIFRALREMLSGGAGGVRVLFDLSTNEDVLTSILRLGGAHRLRAVTLLTMPHGEQRLGAVHLVGGDADAFIDDLWSAGHLVVSVTRPQPAVA